MKTISNARELQHIKAEYLCNHWSDPVINLDQENGTLSCAKVKKLMKYCPVPEDQKWRVSLVKDLLEFRWNRLEIDVIQDQVEDTDAAIETLCLM